MSARLTGVCYIGMNLVAVYTMGVHFVDMHLIGVKVEVESGQLYALACGRGLSVDDMDHR